MTQHCSNTLQARGSLRCRNRQLIFFVGLLVAVFPVSLPAQGPCPTSTLQGRAALRSSDLICQLPQVYGAGGLVGEDNSGPLNTTTGHEVHFQASALSSFVPVNAQLGVELSQLPIATPVSGFVFVAGVLAPQESYGPVLTDRAETIGRHKFFVGASYQYFDFDKVDGINLRSFGTVLTHEQEPTVCPSLGVVCIGGEPLYTRDIIATQNRIDLKVHQITFVATYGVGENLDVSIALPVLDVHLGVSSTATIVNFEPPPVEHSFFPVTSNPYETYVDPYNASFHNHQAAVGIGDVTLRGKYRAWQASSEKSSIAVGLDVRLPTGDAYNFLGAGTWGIRPFLTYTRSGRLSPHATVGFQGNGNSILAGDVTSVPVVKAKLPDIFTYSGGADFALLRRLSVSSDYIGESLLDASQTSAVTYTDYAQGKHNNISNSFTTINEANLALGGKVEIKNRFLFIGNVLFRLNDAGLHSKPAPLAGLSYTF